MAMQRIWFTLKNCPAGHAVDVQTEPPATNVRMVPGGHGGGPLMFRQVSSRGPVAIGTRAPGQTHCS